jgi:hypothetical protein
VGAQFKIQHDAIMAKIYQVVTDQDLIDLKKLTASMLQTVNYMYDLTITYSNNVARVLFINSFETIKNTINLESFESLGLLLAMKDIIKKVPKMRKPFPEEPLETNLLAHPASAPALIPEETVDSGDTGDTEDTEDNYRKKELAKNQSDKLRVIVENLARLRSQKDWKNMINALNDYANWIDSMKKYGKETYSQIPLQKTNIWIQQITEEMLRELEQTKIPKIHQAGSLITVAPDRPLQSAVPSFDADTYERLTAEDKQAYDAERANILKSNVDNMNKWLQETSGNVSVQEMSDRYRKAGITNPIMLQELIQAELRQQISSTWMDEVKIELAKLGITYPIKIEKYIRDKMKIMMLNASGVGAITAQAKITKINPWDIINEAKKDVAILSREKAGKMPLMSVRESQPDPSYKSDMIEETMKIMAEGDLMDQKLEPLNARFIKKKLKEIEKDDGQVGDKLNQTMKEVMEIDEKQGRKETGIVVLDQDLHLCTYLT